MIFETLVVIVVLYAVNWYFKTRDYRNKLSKLKCEPYWPIFGHVLQLGVENGDLLNSLERMWNNLGRDTFLVKLGTKDQIVITKPEDVELILSSTVMMEKNYAYDVMKPWIGEGLITSNGNGPIWKIHRKLLTPAFHFKVLETYVDSYDEEAKKFVQNVLQKPNQDLETIVLIGAGITSSLARSALGVSFADKEQMNIFKSYSQKASNIITKRIFSMWKNIDFLFNLTNEHKELQHVLDTIHSIVRQTYSDKKEELRDLIEAIASGKTTVEELTTRDEFSKKRLSFIEILLLSKKPNGEPLSVEEINDEVNTFVFAGVETATITVCMTMYLLAKYPEIQGKVYQEQLEITNGDLTQLITYADVQNMKYLERVFKESLRLYPAAMLFGRKINSDTTLKDGTLLPAGSSITFLPYLTHRHPDLFKDPLKFDPDRFLERVPNFTYYPFSAGSRNCIGQKLANVMIKTWLATIIRSCIILPSKEKDVHVTTELTMTSTTGVHLKFQKRT